MVGTAEVLGRMLILRRIAATHVSADEAKAQVDPCVAQLHAFWANVNVGSADFDLINMFAGHGSLGILIS